MLHRIDTMSDTKRTTAAGLEELGKCPACQSDLSRSWPDFSSIPRSRLGERDNSVWLEGAKLKCPFCTIIVSVFEDAKAKFTYPKFDLDSFPEPWFLVDLHRDENNRFLLVLQRVLMPQQRGSVKPTLTLGSLHVYLDGPDNLQSRLKPYTSVPKRGISPSVMDLARKWLRVCRESHVECATPTSDTGYLPSRLLEIMPSKIRLVDDTSSLLNVRYMALSHCWGSAQPLKTVSSNLSEHKKCIELKNLPRNFVDTIYVARQLGFQYVWIDSLCIIQDNSEDWERESSRMASVYGNADLVLAAAAAASADHGFLGARYSHCEASLALDLSAATIRLRYRLVGRHEHDFEPIDLRAWAFQERLTARRYLAFGRSELAWECQQTSLCECDWARYGSSPRGGSMSSSRSMRSVRERESGRYWRRDILESYTERQLTNRTDKLVALSALAAQFQARYGYQYLAGLWKEDLIRGLLWKALQTESDIKASMATAEDFYAPSWSWVSVRARRLEFFFDLENSEERELVSILNATTTPISLNPFGSLSSGTITLRGKLYAAHLFNRHGNDLYEWNFEMLRTDVYRTALTLDGLLTTFSITLEDGRQGISARRLRYGEQLHVEQTDRIHQCLNSVYCLPLLVQTRPSGSSFRLHCLLLGRAESNPAHFERLGMSWVHFEDEMGVTAFLDKAETRTVVLI